MIKTTKNTIAELKPALKATKIIAFTEENKVRAVLRCSIYFKCVRKTI